MEAAQELLMVGVVPGFQRIYWKDTEIGQEVRLWGTLRTNDGFLVAHAYGPHIVVSPEQHQLRNKATGTVFVHLAEELLVPEDKPAGGATVHDVTAALRFIMGKLEGLLGVEHDKRRDGVLEVVRDLRLQIDTLYMIQGKQAKLPVHIREWLDVIGEELMEASERYGAFYSPHEGYAIIKEELDEMWDAIKNNEKPINMTHEVVQVGAMALRFLVDLCSG